MKISWFRLVVVIVLAVPLLGLFGQLINAKRFSSSNSSVMMAPARDMAAVSEGKAMPEIARYDDSVAIGMPVEPPIGGTDGSFTPGVERTIIKTAQLSLVTDDTRAAAAKVQQIAESHQGLVTNSNVFEGGYKSGALQAEIDLRVPVAQLDATLTELRAVGRRIISETMSSSDQTEQKVDLEAQLRNLQATEQQLLGIMRQAKTVEETLSVQRELSSVRSQIERLQAQIENLTGAAAMSSIHVSITTEEGELPVVDGQQPSVWSEIKAAFRSAIQLYRSLFVSGLQLLIIGAPIWIIAIIGFWLNKRRSATRQK